LIHCCYIFSTVAIFGIENRRIPKLKQFIRYIFLSINLLAALLLAISYISPVIDPQTFWWPSVLGLGYIYLLLLNVSFIILWIIFYWRYLFISLLFVLIGINVHKNVFNFSSQKVENVSGISVLSYNVLHFYSYLENQANEDNILTFIAKQEANIICLQETKLQKTGNLNPLKLKAHFPGIIHCQLAHQSKWNGPVTFTSYPIVHMGEIRYENTNNMVIYTDVKVEQDTMRIYNCHLQSYGIREDDYSIIDTLGFQNQKLREVKQLGIKLKDAYKQRSSQIKQLKEHIEACPYPVIVCGDFNDTPVSYTYHSMRSILNDSFTQSGRGLSNTYRGKLPPFRIDYIFYSDEFEAMNYQRHNVEYSDHFPISATIVKKK
jgi:endonuclease/exonuclease/phosphatase (EEP) superfamily protein YafD